MLTSSDTVNADLIRRGESRAAVLAPGPGGDEIDVHMTISALCFFNVANRSTFFKRDMPTPEALARQRAIVIDTVTRYVRADRAPEDIAG